MKRPRYAMWVTALAILTGCPAQPEDKAARRVDGAQARAEPVSQPITTRFEAPLVSPSALKQRLARGERITIIDVRSRSAFDAEHIAGAVSHPRLDLIEGHPPLPKDRLYALYCT